MDLGVEVLFLEEVSTTRELSVFGEMCSLHVYHSSIIFFVVSKTISFSHQMTMLTCTVCIMSSCHELMLNWILFRQAYNRHILRTEHLSPLQLWMRGMLRGTSDQEAASGVYETITEVILN